MVDTTFDFETEERSIDRVRQRDDKYAHEVFAQTPYDGLLVSKGVVEGVGQGAGKYTFAQRQRLFREGAHNFFRADMPMMGDCGAFSYVNEEKPPFSVQDVLDFYGECDFDYGISVDHVILSFQPKFDDMKPSENPNLAKNVFRRELTLELAEEFLKEHKAQGYRFKPVGVAHGWSPKTYAESVQQLQKIGYDYIAIGGLVPLKTGDILECLVKIAEIRDSKTKLHLLGVTRVEKLQEFASLGVESFDSTSPLRQAFKDSTDNYYSLNNVSKEFRTYTAIRIPQVDGNQNLRLRIRSGELSQDEARKLEQSSLNAMRDYSKGRVGLESALDAVVEYDQFCSPNKDKREEYREVLESKPWKECACDVCTALDYHVILFRGAERNRRRGFHNVWTFFNRVRSIDLDGSSTFALSGG